MKEFFNEAIYNPLYNGLVFFIDVVPYADVGIAVIALTVLVKILLFPVDYRAKEMQAKMQKLAPEMEEIKKTHKDDKAKQTHAILDLYRKHKVNPFFGFLALFIQLPIIFGLYFVFYSGGLPKIDGGLLYSWVKIPESVNMIFLGMIDMGGRSVLIATLAGVTQYFQGHFVMHPPKPKSENPSIQEDLAHSMHFQMRYVMPIIITFVSYSVSSAVALYWTTSNIFAIGQELMVRRIRNHKNNI